MSRRTRLTYQGMKTSFRKKRESRHGPIKRIVGDTPMKTIYEASIETLAAELGISTDEFYAAVKYGGKVDEV